MPDKKTPETEPFFHIGNAEGYPEGVRAIIFDSEIGKEPVPIFDVRQLGHHALIAQRYATYGELGVVHGIGLYGAVWPIKSPSAGAEESYSQLISKFKPGRSSLDKLPLYIRPKHLGQLVDVAQIHEEFRLYFESEEAIDKLYRSAPAIHLIVPVAENADVDDVFITHPDDWKAKEVDEDQHMGVPTVSAFYWYDPMFDHIAELTEERLNDGSIAISSFNKHGEEPAWNFEGLLKYLEQNVQENGCPFDYVVYDPLLNEESVGSSFVQVAPPLVGEEPKWKVYRTGPTNIEAYLHRIGSHHDYRIVRGARQAARRPDLDGVDLDEEMLRVQQIVASEQSK